MLATTTSGSITKITQTTTTVLSTIKGCDITATATTTTLTQSIQYVTDVVTYTPEMWPTSPVAINTAFVSVLTGDILNSEYFPALKSFPS